MSPFNVPPRSALLVIDMQNDFIPGGTLPVAGGDGIIDGIDACIHDFFSAGAVVVLTQDWHPAGHASFASAHPGKQPYDRFENEDGIGPVLWPDHCIQGTRGALIHERIDVDPAHLILRKGYHAKIDSYSAFMENDKRTGTGLAGFLNEHGVFNVFLCGLAYDYCVHYSAIDAASLGFMTSVFLDLTASVGSPPGRTGLVNEAFARHRCKIVRYMQ
jgi:nicotinamidase/pyrazinamidase